MVLPVYRYVRIDGWDVNFLLVVTTLYFDPMTVENNFMSLYVHGPAARVNAHKGGIH